MALSSSQLRGLMTGLAELYRPAADGFPARVISVVSALARADSYSYNHIGSTGLLDVLIEPADIVSFPDAVPVFEQHLPQHPILRHYQDTGDSGARRVSDFLSDRQFRALALYREFYRRTGTNYQMTIAVPLAGDSLLAIALNREHRDFTDEDAGLIDLLRPHIAQAAAIADVLSQPLPAGLPGPDGAPLLTARQSSILQLVAAGQADRQIARTLGISTRTVHAHLQNVYRALGVSSRTEALARLRSAALTAGPPGPR